MPKYFLSICAVVKNESPYIAEWLEFHRLQGVEQFYLYHNGDDENPLIYEDTCSGNDITWLPWPGKCQQNKAYQHCLEAFGGESEWIAFIDVDEFLWSPPYPGDLRYAIDAVCFRAYDDSDIGAIAVHWYLFGSNGHEEKTDGLVIERFTRRSALPDKHVKSIVCGSAISSVSKNPHAFYLRDGFFAISESGVGYPVEYATMPGGTADVLRINHYVTKSRAEYAERKKLGDANSGIVPSEKRIAEMYAAHDCNDVEDTVLRDLYAEKIKEKL